LCKTGANAVFSVGSYIEIDQNYLSASRHFKDYAPLITPKNEVSLVGLGQQFERDDVKKIYGEDLDIPYQWLGISLRNDFIPQIPLNDRTDLSRKLSF